MLPRSVQWSLFSIGSLLPLLSIPAVVNLSVYGTSTPSCARSTWTELGLEPFYKCDKESACQWRNCRDGSSIHGAERYPGEGNGNPLQYSCLENPMDRGAWRATVHSHKDSEATERLTLGLGWQWLWLPRERPRQWTGTGAGSGQERCRTIGPAQPKSWAEPLSRVQRGRAGGRACWVQPPASRP